MSITITHTHVNDGTPDNITPVEWNATHTVVIGTGSITGSMLANTAVTPGIYTNANITIDAQGRVTSATNGSGGGITNSAGNHVVMVSDGTNAIASGISDDGTTVSTARKLVLGGGSQFSATTLNTMNQLSDATTGFAIQDLAAHSKYEAIPFLVWTPPTTTYDTTLQASAYWGIDVECTPTHVAGTNALTLVGIHINTQILSAGGSDVVFPIYTEAGAGVSVFKDGIQAGASKFTSTVNVATSFTTGAVGSSKCTIDSSGNVQIASGGNITQHGTPTAGTNIFGDLTMFGDPTLTGNNAYFSSNSLNGAWDSNATDHLSINRDGYHNSNTQFRDLLLYDGKENLISKLTGSTGEFYATTLRAGGSAGGQFRSGVVTPNTNITGNQGDYYTWVGGGTSTTLWVKESGNGTNTGWVSK